MKKYKNILTIILAIANVFYFCFVTMKIWNMFMPKIGVPNISYWLCMGLIMLKSLLTASLYKKEKHGEDGLFESVFTDTVAYSFILLVSFLINLAL